MFNKKKKKPGSSSYVNMLSEGAEAKGQIRLDDDIRIAGKLEGDLMTKGKTFVTPSGVVNGNIRGMYADIAGTVEGEIRVSDKIVIRKSAVIKGNVFTKYLLVEDGAHFDGTLRLSYDNIENVLSPNGQVSGSDTKNTEDELDTTPEKAATNGTGRKG
jgi:cytoskeletal protein CcmA (bactofilin family)